MEIVLASGSVYRKALLARLHIPFTTFDANIDEEIALEDHDRLVTHLSAEKASVAQKRFPEAICIGCDTIATLGAERLGKPLEHATAVKQLQAMSGKTVYFYSGIAVAYQPKDFLLTKSVVTEVTFRTLTLKMIEHYLQTVKPYNSCGSFQSETLGCALIKTCQSDDPSAIIGLPLITLCDMLAEVGFDVFAGS